MIARRRLVVAALLALGACSVSRRRPVRTVPPETAAEAEWPNVHRDAMNAIIVRDLRRADSLLRAFATRYPGTPYAAETVFLRSIVRLDPLTEANAPSESSRQARAFLEAYIAGGATQPHYVESLVLLRMLGHVDSLHAAADSVRAFVTTTSGPLASPLTRDSARAREDEMNRLRTELEQTKAELERIRRRLAPPRPD